MKLPQSARLIVIDAQQAFLDPHWGERNNPEAESNVARLLEAWRKSGRLVRHVVHDSLEPNSLLRAGSPGKGFRPLQHLGLPRLSTARNAPHTTKARTCRETEPGFV